MGKAKANVASWVVDGHYYLSKRVPKADFGEHGYEEDGTSDCSYGCGCWAGPSRSGGPVDPFGACPCNPKKAGTPKFEPSTREISYEEFVLAQQAEGRLRFTPRATSNRSKIQDEVNEAFLDAFGRTPLAERLNDILGEANELHRYTDLANIKEELGDLLSSSLMLANECGWSAEELVRATLEKIKRRRAQYKGLGRKLNIALLGGAFDPPHLGHLAIAKFVLDASRFFDEVWLMPCARHLYNKKMAPYQDRLKMCQLLAKGDGRIRTSDYEEMIGSKGETYNLMKRLVDDPQFKDTHDFSFVIGMDNAISLKKWYKSDLLERMARFVVVDRTGYDSKILQASEQWWLRPPHIYIRPEKPLPMVSSSDIRRSIEAMGGTVILELHGMSKEVLAYVKEHKLYWRP